MLFRVLVLILTIALSSSAIAKCAPEKTKDLIFIHGIASNKRTFGYWESYLKKLHKDYCFNTFYFDYRTGRNDLNIDDFISDFDNYLRGIYKDRAMNKVSIIAHSQGGLITLFLLKKLLSENSNHSRMLTTNLENLITMATPYYGAQIANLGYALGTFLLPILGKIEMKDMKLGSELVFETIDLFDDKSFLDYLRAKNFISVSAMFNSSIKLDIEGDIAVSPFSSNPNIVGARPVSKHYNIEGVHLRFPFLWTPPTTYVLKSCVKKPLSCENSTLGIFEREVLKRSTFPLRLVDDVNTFAVYFRTTSEAKYHIIFDGKKRKLKRLRRGVYFYKGKIRKESIAAKITSDDFEKDIEISMGQLTSLTIH